MTLDSTKGTSLGAEPAPDSSKNDLSKMAETEKNLDDLIVSLKAKLIRSRNDDTKASNSKRNERHILSEKYALSCDRHHRSRDTRSRYHVRSDNRSHGLSRDRTGDWSGDYWHRSDLSRERSRGILSRERSRDTWSDVKMTQKFVGINDGDCSEGIEDVTDGHSRSSKQKSVDLGPTFPAKDDFSHNRKTGEQEVNKILKIKTPETRKFRQNQKSGQIGDYMPYSEQVLELHCSGQEKLNKDHLRTVNKMQLSAVNKCQPQTVDELSSSTSMNDDHRQTDVFEIDLRSQRRQKRKRTFLKTIYNGVPEIRQPASRLRSESPESREAPKSSKRSCSVDQEAEVIRLRADRSRLDHFRCGLKLYASAVLEAQSKLQGLLQDLSTASPSTLLGEGEGERGALGPSAETDCHGNCNCDVEDDLDNLVTDSDGRRNYGESNNEHDRYGDDDGSNGDRGDEDVGYGGHDDNENRNGGQGDDDDGNGSHSDDGVGNGSHSQNKDKGDYWGQRNDGNDNCKEGNSTDGNSVSNTYCDNYDSAKDCNGCHGDVNDRSAGLSESGADQLKFREDRRMEGQVQVDAEDVAVTKDESSVMTTPLELSAPALVPESLTPDCLDPTKPDPPSPPILESFEELYESSQNFDEVLPLTRQSHPVTWWPPPATFVPLSSAAANSETSPTAVVNRRCTGWVQSSESGRPEEESYASPGSKEQPVNRSSLVSKEQLVSHVDMRQITSCPVSKKLLLNHSSRVSKEQLVGHLDMEQIHSSSVIREQLTRGMDPEENNSIPVSKEQPASKLEESFTPESSFSTGNLEKRGNQDDRPIFSMSDKFDSESIRARYAKAASALSKLTSILSVRQKSKLVVDAKLEHLRRELFRLKVNFFVEKKKLCEETKAGFSKGCGSSDVDLGTACDDGKPDVSNRQLSAFQSSYSPPANDKQPEKTAKTARLTEEAPVKLSSSLSRGPSIDRTACHSGLSPESLIAASDSAVDLSTKVHGKPEADVKSDGQWIQDVVWLDSEDAGDTANLSLTPISRHSLQGTQNSESRSPNLRRRSLEDVPLKDFDAAFPSESSDIGDDCSGRVLNLVSDKRADHSQMSLCPKKRLRQKYRDQTEQERDSSADGATHSGVLPAVHRVQRATLLDPQQLDHAEYSRLIEQRCRGFPRPSRDFQTRQLASPPPESLPSPTMISSQKIAVISAHFREAEKRLLPEQSEKLLPLNEASEPARKRRVISRNRDHCQPVLSHQHKTHTRNDNPNNDPDVNGLSSHGNGITAYQTTGSIANHSISLTANHNPSLIARGTASRTANQPPRMPSTTRRLQSSLRQAQTDSPSFAPSKSFAEFPNSGPIPLEIGNLHGSGVAQWCAADSKKPHEYGSEIARNFPPGAYISPNGCVLPNYTFPSDPRDQTYPAYLANHSFEYPAFERDRLRLLDMGQAVPEHVLFSSVRIHPEDPGRLFSMGGSSRHLLSSATALMSPTGIPGFYHLPNGAYYGDSALNPEFYMTAKNPYDLTQF